MPVVKNYCRGLTGTSYDRYVRKIALCEGIDPYEMDEKCLRTEISELPLLSSVDLTVYFISTTDFYTKEQMKAFKSLEAHNFFTSGWVKAIKHHTLPSGNVIVFGWVNHSQALSQSLLNPWVLCKSTGEVLTAHCTCMAGNCSACSHAAAVLFAVEYASRRREKATCTSLPNSWLPTYSSNAPYLQVRDYDFSSANARKRKVDGSKSDFPLNVPMVAKKLPVVSNQRFDQFLSEVFTTDKNNCALFRVAPKFCDNFKTKDCVSLPPPLTKLFDSSLRNKSSAELKQKCEAVFKDLSYTEHQCAEIEKATRGQSQSPVWKMQRLGRITASIMKTVCNADLSQPSLSFLKQLCYNTDTFQTDAMKWGSVMEKVALADYEDTMLTEHVNFQIQEGGLHVSCESPYLGASPDGITNCDCHGKGIVEIKCPSGASNYLDDNNNLPSNHQYRYQVQTIMMIMGLDWCDFFVWRMQGPWPCIRVMAGKVFQAQIKNEASMYFKEVVLPELLARKFSSLSHVLADLGQHQKIICSFRKPHMQSDKIVVCSGKCQTRVYHLHCVGLKRASKKWKCKECGPKKKK